MSSKPDIPVKSSGDTFSADELNTIVDFFENKSDADELIPGPEGPQGIQGPEGPKGDDGKSAYHIAVDNGFVGTEQEWLESLSPVRYMDGDIFEGDGETPETKTTIKDGSIGEEKLSEEVRGKLDVRVGIATVTLEKFGGASNDVSHDNTPALESAVDYLLDNGGGKIQMLGGTYEFKTPFITTAPFTAIELCGTGMNPPGYGQGTRLNYSGSEYFLNIIEGGQNFKIHDFTLHCNGANGIKLKQGAQVISQSSIKNIRVSGFIEGIDIQDFVYLSLEEVTLLAPLVYETPNTDVDFGIRVGAGSGVKEFLYMNKVFVDAGAGSNADDTGVTGTAVDISNCNNIYINNCDFSNWGTGRSMYIHTNGGFLFGIFIDNLNVIRADGGIEFYEETAAITHVIIQNLMFTHRGVSETERGIYCHRESFFALVGAQFDKLLFRKLGSVTPTYDVQVIAGGTPKIGFCHSQSGGTNVGTS